MAVPKWATGGPGLGSRRCSRLEPVLPIEELGGAMFVAREPYRKERQGGAVDGRVGWMGCAALQLAR